MIPAARAALERVGGATVVETLSSGDEGRATREALARGATTIVALGGDGTVRGVASELVRANCKVPLAIFSAGTGNDFVKSLQIRAHDFGAMAALISAGRVRTIDAARVDDDVFVNIAGFGFDTEVLAGTLQPGWLRGNAMYVRTAVTQLFRYRGFPAVVRSEASWSEQWLTLIFANGAWFGAGFHIAPGAEVDDGLLSAVMIRDASPRRRAALFARATRSRHIGQPEVRTANAPRFVLQFTQRPWYQADGELRQAAGTTVIVEAIPAALRVVA